MAPLWIIDCALPLAAICRCMILTVGNTKGGTGKTTLAVQLAISLARARRDVLLVDGDRGLGTDSIAVRAKSGRQPAVACVQFAEGRVLRDQVRLQVRAIRTC